MCHNAALFLFTRGVIDGTLAPQVLSIEKAESTSSLPNPVIVSVRTKKAFQLIDLPDRDELVESVSCRLRSLQWKQSMFRSRKDGKRKVVRVMSELIPVTFPHAGC